jgi:predicted acylesterase/phospholipase RssA
MAIPFMYPPERIGDDHFADGAIQQLSPISAAIHLGSEKVLKDRRWPPCTTVLAATSDRQVAAFVRFHGWSLLRAPPRVQRQA